MEGTYRLGRVIDHVHLRVADLDRSRTFYRAIASALSLEDAFEDGGDHFVMDELYFDLAEDGKTSRVHLAFQALTHEAVRSFHEAALAAGGTDNGAPGLREYHDRYYAAFVLDPDGNNIEAVSDAPVRRSADAITVERIPLTDARFNTDDAGR